MKNEIANFSKNEIQVIAAFFNHLNTGGEKTAEPTDQFFYSLDLFTKTQNHQEISDAESENITYILRLISQEYNNNSKIGILKFEENGNSTEYTISYKTNDHRTEITEITVTTEFTDDEITETEKIL